MKIGLAYDSLFMEHRPDGYHPENPKRLTACLDGLHKSGLWEKLRRTEVRPADRELLETVHDTDYLDMLDRRLSGVAGYLDPDTYYSPRSLDAALLAAGAGASLASMVLNGGLDSGLALVTALAEQDPQRPEQWLDGVARKDVVAMLDGLANNLRHTPHPLPEPD